VRITAQLIDAENGAHLWADRYDRDLTDIFEVQDDVTHRIVDALKVTLSPTEKAQRSEAKASDMEAYELSLRAREVLLGPTKNRETFEQARKLFVRALELDPNFAKAHAGLAFAYMFDYQNRWSDNPDASLGLAKEYAERAIEKDPKEALAHAVAAVVATFSRDIERAQSEIDTALSLNPNMAMAYNIKGGTRIYLGRPEEAIPLIERAMRLDPATNQQFLHFLGMANLLAGRYETAAAALRERIRLVPNTDFSRSLLASALGHLGQTEEARRVWQELIEINPKYSFEEHLGRLPFKHEADAQRLTEGLRKAGVLN
jgi:adenylate cyclase